jgi:hypothetical protein
MKQGGSGEGLTGRQGHESASQHLAMRDQPSPREPSLTSCLPRRSKHLIAGDNAQRGRAETHDRGDAAAPAPQGGRDRRRRSRLPTAVLWLHCATRRSGARLLQLQIQNCQSPREKQWSPHLREGGTPGFATSRAWSSRFLVSVVVVAGRCDQRLQECKAH